MEVRVDIFPEKPLVEKEERRPACRQAGFYDD